MALDVDLTVTSDAGIWTDGEPLVCCAVVPEAPNTATFSFVSPSGKQFRYEPGQFLTLELPVPGRDIVEDLHNLLLALATADHRRDGQSPAGQHRHALDAGPPQAGDADQSDGTSGHLHPAPRDQEKVSLYLRRVGHHTVVVDDHVPLRPGHRYRHRVRQLCAAPAGHHLPPATGTDGKPGAVDQTVLHCRRRRPLPCLDRASRRG